ncbi:hypothetical protein RA280_07585 [Cupriavidus sp. CV2]|uniref:hypothetical protein n=1 Tax=Cupriavidus ulmosensis TaxID=3065913 RepID=UPI00296B3716|nr:hypothetical protein [Cupriavidus sp. CV2]MDW3681610.1 hypothetical protein [Cupriavidus sp. CV2]
MIRITRPAAAPARLQLGVALVEAMDIAIASNPNVAGQESEPFDFDSKIYGHRTVKNALKAAQHDKCAYCEAIFSGNASGDVEHFRPKAFSQQSKGSAKLYPGYYWLAYEWSNLLYTCELCNRPVKRNLFPLQAPNTRARRSADDLAAETPLLIDPAGPADPREHIRFRNNKPYGITEQGRETVTTMGLDRSQLDDARLRHIRVVEYLRKIADLEAVDPQVTEVIQEARTQLALLVKPEAPFSSMTQDLLSN